MPGESFGEAVIWGVMYAIVIILIIVIYVAMFRTIPTMREKQAALERELDALGVVFQEDGVRATDGVVRVAAQFPVLRERMGRLENEMVVVHGNVKRVEGATSNVDAKLMGHMTGMSNLVAQVGTVMQEGATAFVDNMLAMDTAWTGNVKSMSSRLGTLEKSVGALGPRLNQYDIDLGAHASNITGVMGTTNRLTAEMGLMTSNFGRLQSDIGLRVTGLSNDIWRVMNATNATLGALDGDLRTGLRTLTATVGTNFNTLSGNITTLSNNTAAVDRGFGSRISGLESSFSTIQGSVSSLNNSIASYSGSLNSLATQVGGLSSANVGLNSSLTALNSQVATLSNQNMTQNTSLATLGNQVVSLSNQNATQNATLATLSNQNRAQDSSLATLSNVVSSTTRVTPTLTPAPAPVPVPAPTPAPVPQPTPPATVVSLNSQGLVGYYKAEDFRNGIWYDTSGANNHATGSGSISVGVTNGVLNNKNYLRGGTGASITWPVGILPAQYTLFHVARYAASGTKQRIFTGNGQNWLSGFWNGISGTAYHNGWIITQNGNHGTNWVMSVDQNNYYRSNRVDRGRIAGGNPSYTRMTINNGNPYGNEKSDWEVACVVIYNYTLNPSSIAEVERKLGEFYGI